MLNKNIIYWLVGSVGLIALVLIAAVIGTYRQTGDISQSIGAFGGSVSSAPNEIFVSDMMAPSPEIGMDRGVTLSDEDAGQNTDEEFVIKTGSITMNVKSIDESVGQITAIAQNYGGSLLNKTVNDYDGNQRFGYLTLQVEEQHFDKAFAEIVALGTQVEVQDVSSEDVTEQVVDLQARLSNARLEEASYLDVLNRAESVEDILKVHSYLSQVRETIERYEAQLEYYNTHTSFSRIYVNLSEDVDITFDNDEFRPLQAIKDAAQAVVGLFQSVVVIAIYFVIIGGAILLPLTVIFFVAYLIIKKIKKQKK